MEIAILTTCASSIDAHLIKSKLASEGIEAYLVNENFTNFMPHLYNILGGGVRIIVKEEDRDSARSILNIHSDRIRCPNFGSDSIQLACRRSRGNLIGVVLSLIAGLPFGNLLNQYVCNNCSRAFTR